MKRDPTLFIIPSEDDAGASLIPMWIKDLRMP
jgi:hypothetical protein